MTGLESSSVQELEPRDNPPQPSSSVGNGVTTSLSLPLEIPQSIIFDNCLLNLKTKQIARFSSVSPLKSNLTAVEENNFPLVQQQMCRLNVDSSPKTTKDDSRTVKFAPSPTPSAKQNVFSNFSPLHSSICETSSTATDPQKVRTVIASTQNLTDVQSVVIANVEPRGNYGSNFS